MTDAGAYLAVFLLMTLAFIGLPAAGPAVVGWAAIQAAASDQDWESLVALIGGLAVAAGCAVLAARYYRRRRARRLAARPPRTKPARDDDDTPDALTRQG
jgi:hypothetical protein